MNLPSLLDDMGVNYRLSRHDSLRGIGGYHVHQRERRHARDTDDNPKKSRTLVGFRPRPVAVPNSDACHHKNDRHENSHTRARANQSGESNRHENRATPPVRRVRIIQREE